MNATIQTIPELLIQTRGNQTEVARMLSCARGTVLKYNRDSKGERHVIVNGVLMVKQEDAFLRKRNSAQVQPRQQR
nr:MAG TPA: NinH protein [Caudoviricetes sp.]